MMKKPNKTVALLGFTIGRFESEKTGQLVASLAIVL